MAFKRNPYGKRSKRTRVVRARRTYSRNKKILSNAKLTRMIKRLPPPEVKQVRMLYNNTGGFGLPDFNSASWSLDNGIYTLHPTQNRISIAQGTGQGQRVGNRIRVKSCYISGILYAQQQNAAYNPTPKPCEVVMYIYRLIGGGNTVDTTMTNFYQNGNTAGSPTGSLVDLTFPINKDRYRIVYRRVFKIGPADNTGTGSSAGLQYFANNDYKRNQRFYIPLTKYMDKIIRYNDTSLTCNNDTLYLAILPLMADGSANAAGNALLPVNCSMTQVFNYTDV